MTATALTMSIIAVVLSAASLSWQAWSWLRSGPVLRVKVANSIAAPDGVEPEHFISLNVSNTGRSAATVTGFGIRMPNGQDYVIFRPPWFSTKTPARIESHAGAMFCLPADELRVYAAEKGIPFKRMRPFVRTAADKEIFSKKPVPLA